MTNFLGLQIGAEWEPRCLRLPFEDFGARSFTCPWVPVLVHGYLHLSEAPLTVFYLCFACAVLLPDPEYVL